MKIKRLIDNIKYSVWIFEIGNSIEYFHECLMMMITNDRNLLKHGCRLKN